MTISKNLWGNTMEEKELNLTEEEEHLLKIIFKLGETLVYETGGFNSDSGDCIDANTLYELKQKLGIYEVVD